MENPTTMYVCYLHSLLHTTLVGRFLSTSSLALCMDSFDSRSIGPEEPSDRPSYDRAERPFRSSYSAGSRMHRRGSRYGSSRSSRFVASLESTFRWLKQRGWKKNLRDLVLFGGGFLILYFLFLWLTLPDISERSSLLASQSSRIVDRNGQELYRLFDEQDRTFIPLTDIPVSMQQAIIAIEDERFYDRGCLDVRALARVVFYFGQSGGASTITRQLARNALELRQDNIINRKLKELILGCQLESSYTKDELLELYLNWIPFGSNAYGVEQASQRYFGASASELSLAQSSILASLPQLPSYYSPYGTHVHTRVTDAGFTRIMSGDVTSVSDLTDEEIIPGLIGNRIGSGSISLYLGGRTDQVLRNMENIGFINEAERLAALDELETISFEQAREDIRAPHFVLWVRDQVEELLEGRSEGEVLRKGGLTIETTLNWELQQFAESAVARNAENRADVYTAYNTSLVAIDPQTREILAYVGNTDYNDDDHDGKVDMARIPRQPGSSFKPFAYTAAFENGYSPASVIYDLPITIGGTDRPQNFDGQFDGLTTIRDALGASRNIPAVKAFFLGGGEDAVLDVASRLGATTPAVNLEEQLAVNPEFEYGWPLALGAAETPLTEMVNAYASFADGGEYRPIVSILRITDRLGRIVYEHEEERSQDGVDPRIAYQITSILSDVSARPTEYWQGALSIPGATVAAKTGTSNACLERDDNGNCTERRPDNLWTIGYVPSLAVGVWVGNADATPLATRAESLTLASPIWKSFFTSALQELDGPVTTFSQPSGMVRPQVSMLSGQLPQECTPVNQRRADVFLSNRAPNEPDPGCQRLEIDRVTGLLASDSCPASARVEQDFFVVDAASNSWAAWQQGAEEWAQENQWTFDPTTGEYTAASGSKLPLPLAPTAECDVSKTPGRMVAPSLTFTYPGSGDEVPYPAFRVEIDATVGSSIRDLSFEIDGRTARTESGISVLEPIVLVPRTVQQGGQHTLTVTLTDRYFNTATAETTFRFGEDRSGPQVRLTSPPTATIIAPGETLSIQASADDDEGSIRYVQFYLDDELLTTKPFPPYSFSYTFDREPGTYWLRSVAQDRAGNETEDRVQIRIREESDEGEEAPA